MDTSCGTPWNTATTNVPRERSIHIFPSFSLTLSSFSSFNVPPRSPRHTVDCPSLLLRRPHLFPSCPIPARHPFSFFLVFSFLSLSLSLSSGWIEFKVERSKVIFSKLIASAGLRSTIHRSCPFLPSLELCWLALPFQPVSSGWTGDAPLFITRARPSSVLPFSPFFRQIFLCSFFLFLRVWYGSHVS